MNDILFSSWGGRVVDNRGKEPQAYEPADHVELPEYFKQDQKIKALLGWDGIIIRSEDVDIIDFLRAYLEANLAHAKTCDKCNYCKTGWEEQLEVFEDIYNGEATEEDLEFLESLKAYRPLHGCLHHSSRYPQICGAHQRCQVCGLPRCDP